MPIPEEHKSEIKSLFAEAFKQALTEYRSMIEEEEAKNIQENPPQETKPKEEKNEFRFGEWLLGGY